MEEQNEKQINNSANVASETSQATSSNADNRLVIEPSIVDILPAMVKDSLSKMSESKQRQFVEEFNRKKKSTGLAYFFLILCFGAPYGYLGKWGFQVIYWISLFFLVGIIWFIYLLFALPGLVNNANKEIAIQIVRDIKIME